MFWDHLLDGELRKAVLELVTIRKRLGLNYKSEVTIRKAYNVSRGLKRNGDGSVWDMLQQAAECNGAKPCRCLLAPALSLSHTHTI